VKHKPPMDRHNPMRRTRLASESAWLWWLASGGCNPKGATSPNPASSASSCTDGDSPVTGTDQRERDQELYSNSKQIMRCCRLSPLAVKQTF
jgi:hypothetical protein